MANDFTARTWVLDTAGATSLHTGPVYIGHMEWHPTAAGQSLKVQDGLGNTIWPIDSVTAGNDASAGIEEWKNPEHKVPFDGFQVSIMDGGVLYVTVV